MEVQSKRNVSVVRNGFIDAVLLIMHTWTAIVTNACDASTCSEDMCKSLGDGADKFDGAMKSMDVGKINRHSKSTIYHLSENIIPLKYFTTRKTFQVLI